MECSDRETKARLRQAQEMLQMLQTEAIPLQLLGAMEAHPKQYMLLMTAQIKSALYTQEVQLSVTARRAAVT